MEDDQELNSQNEDQQHQHQHEIMGEDIHPQVIEISQIGISEQHLIIGNGIEELHNEIQSHDNQEREEISSFDHVHVHSHDTHEIIHTHGDIRYEGGIYPLENDMEIESLNLQPSVQFQYNFTSSNSIENPFLRNPDNTK